MHALEGFVGYLIAILVFKLLNNCEEVVSINNVPDSVNFLLSGNVLLSLLNVLFIKINKGLVNGSALHFKALVNAADVGTMHVTAAAATLDIFNGSLTEKCNFFAFAKGKRLVSIFKEHHTLGCCSA